uniref:Uncharacterized protein n=1 Tax=Clastoptera arizonana TaxID=38151 RepID=A0A1B6BW83_9HEMI
MNKGFHGRRIVANNSFSSSSSSISTYPCQRRHCAEQVGVKSSSNIYLSWSNDANIHSGREISSLFYNDYTKGLVSLRTVLYCGNTYEAQEVSLHLIKEGMKCGGFIL